MGQEKPRTACMDNSYNVISEVINVQSTTQNARISLLMYICLVTFVKHDIDKRRFQISHQKLNVFYKLVVNPFVLIKLAFTCH